MDHYIHWLVDFISLFAILFLFYQYVFSLYREKKSNVSTIVFFDKWNIIEEKKNYTLSQTNIIGHSTDISVTLGYQTYRKTCNVREKKKGEVRTFLNLRQNRHLYGCHTWHGKKYKINQDKIYFRSKTKILW